jgi:hypothetical protein
MPVNVGPNAITAARYGTANVSRLYQGSTLVWPDGGFPFGGRARFDDGHIIPGNYPRQLMRRPHFQRGLLPSLVSITTDSPIIGGITRMNTQRLLPATVKRRPRMTVQPRRSLTVFEGGGGTYTLSPTANVGWLLTDTSTYLGARSGTGVASGGGSVGYVSADFGGKDGIIFNFFQAFLEFDTSSIVGTITSATLRVHVTSDVSTVDFTIQARLYDYGASLTTGDWLAGASIGASTLLASRSSAGVSDAALNDLTESGTNLQTNINRSGMTRIVLVTDQQSSASDPGQITSYFGVLPASCRLEVVTV